MRAADFGLGFGEGFSVFQGDEAREFVHVFLEQIFQPERYWMRSPAGVRRHAGKAAAAACTAASIVGIGGERSAGQEFGGGRVVRR